MQNFKSIRPMYEIGSVLIIITGPVTPLCKWHSWTSLIIVHLLRMKNIAAKFQVCSTKCAEAAVFYFLCTLNSPLNLILWIIFEAWRVLTPNFWSEWLEVQKHHHFIITSADTRFLIWNYLTFLIIEDLTRVANIFAKFHVCTIQCTKTTIYYNFLVPHNSP